MSGDWSAFGGVSDAIKHLVVWTRLSRQAHTPQDRQINGWQAVAAETLIDDALAAYETRTGADFGDIARARLEEWGRLTREAPTEREREKFHWHVAAAEQILGDLTVATSDALTGIRERSNSEQTQLRD